MAASNDRYMSLINSLLIAAARDGNYHTVETLLSEGADPQTAGNAALKHAAESGFTEIVLLLLLAGADARADNDLPLRSAAANGHAGIVRILLDRRADPSVHDHKPLRIARERGHDEVVRLLEREHRAMLEIGTGFDTQLVNALRERARPHERASRPLNGHKDFVAAVRDLDRKQRDLEQNLEALNAAVFSHFDAKGELFHEPNFRTRKEDRRAKLREAIEDQSHTRGKNDLDPKP